MKINEIIGDKRNLAVDNPENIYDEIKVNCSQALDAAQHNIRVYRGLNNITDKVLLVDPTLQKRKSKWTSNYYTMMIDSLPEWKAYPKRSESLICSTSYGYAIDYADSINSLYLVLPFDNANFGISSFTDFQNSKYIDNLCIYELNGIWKRCKLSEDNLSAFINDYTNNFGEILEYVHGRYYIQLSNMMLKYKDNPLEFVKQLYNPVAWGYSHGSINSLEGRKDSEVWTNSKSYLIRGNTPLFNTLTGGKYEN
jgi:hypothetical protein